MRQLFEEYGRYAIAIIAVLISVGFFVYNALSPTGKLHHYIEQAINVYLASDTQTSYEKTEVVTEADPLEFKVVATCKINNPTELNTIFKAKDGSTLKYVRILNTDDNWSVSGSKITFTQPGNYKLRIYGENDAGQFGTASFWIGVNRV